jgi:biopolymer transport protein ExbB/TolQ
MLVMQVGLLVSFTVIGVATVILVKISEALAVATVGGFVVAHVAILAAYFWTHARGQVIERKAL